MMKQNILALVGLGSWVYFCIKEPRLDLFIAAMVALICFAEVAKMALRSMEELR